MKETLIKTGTILIATDVCEMQFSNKHALVIGKEYKVLGFEGDCFYIDSEDSKNHTYEINSFRDFFKIKGEQINNKIEITLPQLTKREYFASYNVSTAYRFVEDMTVKSISDYIGIDTNEYKAMIHFPVAVVKMQLQMADELLKQLESKQP
jgi:hypothetical protein